METNGRHNIGSLPHVHVQTFVHSVLLSDWSGANPPNAISTICTSLDPSLRLHTFTDVTQTTTDSCALYIIIWSHVSLIERIGKRTDLEYVRFEKRWPKFPQHPQPIVQSIIMVHPQSHPMRGRKCLI